MENPENIREPVTEYKADDGLLTPEVGSWAEKKYRLLALYDELFSTGTKNSWDQRVYVDLFAGAGKVRIRNTSKVINGSPLLALGVPNKFTHHIFCEENSALMTALKARVGRSNTGVSVQYLEGDCNQKIEDVLREIPNPSRTNKVLTFCFVDPFSLNIDFESIRSLCRTRYVDFLILLALSMDAGRNETLYVDENNDRIDRFLGTKAWRLRWKEQQKIGKNFRMFLAAEYAKQMIELGYRSEALAQMIEVRSDEKNLPLYHLAFFSRHPLGYRYWKQVQKYATNQEQLFEN